MGSRWVWIEGGPEGSDESLDDPEDSLSDLRGGEEGKLQRQTGSDLIVLRKMKEDEVIEVMERIEKVEEEVRV